MPRPSVSNHLGGGDTARVQGRDTRAMRIIYLHQYFNTPAKKGGTFSYEMARWLARQGHEVQVVASDTTSSGEGWSVTEESGLRVHWHPVPYSNQMSYARRIRAFGKFAWAAANKAASLPGDVIYAVSPPLTIALPAVRAARKKSIPMVFEVCDLWPATAIAVGALKSRPIKAAARGLERFAYRNAAQIVALSPGTKDGIVATGQPDDKVTVIPMRCDMEAFTVPQRVGDEFRGRYAWLGDRPLVVYTGTLGLVNGCDYLARLAEAVRRRNPQVRFLLVGTGREEDKVRRVAKELGVLGDNFFILPPIPQSEIPAVLSAADLATSTVIDRKAMWACSPSKVMDALGAGRPIAVNHEGWIADFIRQTGCGLVLDAHDVESAADQVVAAVGNKLWADKARAAARRLAKERFDYNKLASRLERILLDLVPQTKRRVAA